MNKIILALKSRTTWTIVLGWIVTAEPLLPPQWKAFVDAVIGLLAVYFHVNPSQNYDQGQQQ